VQAGAAPFRDWLPAAPWDEHRRLREEKVALGFFLSGHLFSAHEGELRRFVKTRLADLPRIVESSHGSTQVTVAGIVAAISSTMTRRGRMMRVVLDDRSASEELAVFSEQYELNRSLLKEDELIVVHGKVSKDEYTGGYRFSAERILDLATARGEYARALKLRMNGGSDARRLAGLLEPFRIGRQQGPGCPVEIEYYNGVAAVSVRLGPDWLVKPDDALLMQLADWLSPQGVELLYR
jgi:DNA polymerase-3 subunit alpha